MQNALMELKEYEDLQQAILKGKGPVQATGTLDSQKVHLMYRLGQSFRWKLVVTYDETRAREIYEDYRNFTKQVWLYPAKDLLFYAADIHGNLMTKQRMQVLKAIMEEKEGVVVTTLDGLMDHLLPLSHMEEQTIWVEAGQQLDLAWMKEQLVRLGYERTGQVDGMGQFSVRGGIVDIFPLTEEFPVRIELWDDEVDSIRSFDLESQRSIEQLEYVRLYPAQEAVLTRSQIEDGIERLRKESEESRKVFRKNGKLEEGHRIFSLIEEFTENLKDGCFPGSLDGYINYFCPDTVSFLRYFPEKDTLLFLDEPVRLQEKGNAVETEFRESMSQRLEKGYLLGGQTGLLYGAKEILAGLQRGATVYLTGLDQRLPGFAVKDKFAFTVKNVNSYQNGFDFLIKDLTAWKREGYRVILLTASRTRAGRLARDLRDYELNAFSVEPESGSGFGPGTRVGTGFGPGPETGSSAGFGLTAGAGAGPDAEARAKSGADAGRQPGIGQDADRQTRQYENSQDESQDAFSPGMDMAEAKVQPGQILVTYGNLHRGFEYPLLKLVIITEGDLFGVEKKRRKRKKAAYEGTKIASFSDLAVGDYVVHEDHGLGIYLGIEKIQRDRVTKDYLKIEYGDGGKLYIPATRLDRIQKYAGSQAKAPKLNKLGSPEWKKTKTKVKKEVQQIARDLVELYAARQATDGYQYGPDTVWQREFEELFPYEETEDQLDAIQSAKKDMESRKIMDRLICGDVGYGKTEVALRVAFKAVQESRQVVYLVPTTILAQQHYNTFVQRMKDFPVRVDMLSRFRTQAQQKKTLEDLRKGMVDIVIGTHRVLSKDVQFKNLGLLIIDEEQRFGVTHKEKIKKLKENVDVLTLTATPIPRTLHMSLVGIRDMSVLEEPPVDRLPIQTYVMEYNEEMVREAIQRELSRNGQVYYVYNRVNDIEELAGRIQKLVPEANVVYAHGQMSERQLERIMSDFVNGEIDVLVSTTIIESGLDIPNANTMIIHDADRMGLSQLYQLRGRVGRSSRTSYAFLMYRRDKILREEAEKRLQAIREFTELGSGIKIAMRDLEIRGAGNVLGAEQHGHMDAVGYDLYCKLLNQAVLALKGQKDRDEEDFETAVECDIDAYIPADYIKNEYQKLDIYKRISAIENEEEEFDMRDELIDRFGDIPKSVENLLTIAAMKAMAHQVYVTEAAIGRNEFKLSFYPKAKLNPEAITRVVADYQGRLTMSFQDAPVLLWKSREKNVTVADMVGQVKEVLKKLMEYGKEA